MDTSDRETKLTLLETSFPALTVSLVAEADRRGKDPAYAAHRWWARRPPTIMRALLLAAILEADTSEEEFWTLYASSERSLTGIQVHDPFMGGGSTLIEASRLGAKVSGTDVDPIARTIVAHGLQPASQSEVSEAGEALMSFLRTHFSVLYPGQGGEPLHWFWISLVTCPRCQETGPLYRSHLLARDCGKLGAVVRDQTATVFDPNTFELHYLESPKCESFKDSIGGKIYINHGTFRDRKYHCPKCGEKSNHRELQTGSAPQKMIAVERTSTKSRRKLYEPQTEDLAAIDTANAMLDEPPVRLHLPTDDFKANRCDPRPRSFGMTAVKDLFTSRQLLVLGAAHAWVQDKNLSPSTNLAIRLILSNALANNNRLCSYATDYGRLSALFSIRGYSLPALAVELNPLHSDGGRGTLQQCLNRVTRSAATKVRRSTWETKTQKTAFKQFNFIREQISVDIQCSSAADARVKPGVDLLVFDPPYYDYILYEELAELFRAWNTDLAYSGQTLQSSISEDESDFGVALADCLRPSILARNSRYPIVFTYHSSREAAWKAIGVALDEAKLRVTSIWPIRSDGHMGHHSYPGNCEWDVVVVCRPLDETTTAKSPDLSHLWNTCLGDFNVNVADRRNFLYAHQMASPRFGHISSYTKSYTKQET